MQIYSEVAQSMKQTRSFLNIQKLIKNEELNMLCWIMITYDARPSDMTRLSAHIKAKVAHDGKIKKAFFQEVMLSFSDIDIIEEALDITLSNHPSCKCKIEDVRRGMKEWADLNGRKISKDTTPNMFTIDAG